MGFFFIKLNEILSQNRKKRKNISRHINVEDVSLYDKKQIFGKVILLYK